MACTAPDLPSLLSVMNLAEVARRAKMSRSTVWHLRWGTRTLRIREVAAVAAALFLSEDELLAIVRRQREAKRDGDRRST